MTSQRWTRIRSPVSPFPHRLHLTFSLGPQQTKRQVAVPAQQKVLPLIPLPPSTLLSHTHTHTALSFMLAIFHLLNLLSILSSLECFVSLSRLWSENTDSHFLLPHVPILCSAHCWSLITPGNPSAFLSLLRMTALRQVKGDVHTLSAGPQMKWPFPSLFHRSYKLSPSTAGTTTPLAL